MVKLLENSRKQRGGPSQKAYPKSGQQMDLKSPEGHEVKTKALYPKLDKPTQGFLESNITRVPLHKLHREIATTWVSKKSANVIILRPLYVFRVFILDFSLYWKHVKLNENILYRLGLICNIIHTAFLTLISRPFSIE